MGESHDADPGTDVEPENAMPLAYGPTKMLTVGHGGLPAFLAYVYNKCYVYRRCEHRILCEQAKVRQIPC